MTKLGRDHSTEFSQENFDDGHFEDKNFFGNLIKDGIAYFTRFRPFFMRKFFEGVQKFSFVL